MKLALRVLLSVAVLLQSAMAGAMPVTSAAAQHAAAAVSMPCDHGEAHEASMPCCSPDRADCTALCGAPALPAATPTFQVPGPAVLTSATPRSERRPAHRYTPLRPPIAHSA
jgi:hypothetical protein